MLICLFCWLFGYCLFLLVLWVLLLLLVYPIVLFVGLHRSGGCCWFGGLFDLFDLWFVICLGAVCFGLVLLLVGFVY